MNLSPKVLHLVAVCAGVLVYLSTDQEFISMLTLAQQHWMHIGVGLLVYLGVSQVSGPVPQITFDNLKSDHVVR